MEEKGQVYFASDGEVPQEDRERYEEALRKEEERVRREFWEHRNRLDRRDDSANDWLKERAELVEALKAQSEASSREGGEAS